MTAVSDTPLTPLSFLRRSAEVYPDRTAVVYGDRRISYSELTAQTARVAQALRASGVGAGDRVAYLVPNLPEMLVAHFAVPLAGAVLVAINTRLSPEEVRYICDHSGAKLLVVDAGLYPTVGPVAAEFATVSEIVALTDPAAPGAGATAALPYDDFVARGSDDPLPWAVTDETTTISINYTSGTTGKPKGVMYTYRGAYLNALGEMTRAGDHAGLSARRHDGGRAAEPDHHPADGTHGIPDRARLRPHRDLRPVLGVPVAARVGRPRPARRERGCGPARPSAWCRPTGCGWSTRPWPTCPPTARPWARHARQQRDGRLLRGPRRHREGLRRWLVPLRRPGRDAPTATSSCATGPGTSSSPAGRTSPPWAPRTARTPQVYRRALTRANNVP